MAYRLSILSEPRARRLVERVAELADWTSRGPGGAGKGLGMAFARYKNRAAYAAVAASVTVDETSGSIACGASPTPASWSIPTARATSSKAASSRR